MRKKSLWALGLAAVLGLVQLAVFQTGEGAAGQAQAKDAPLASKPAQVEVLGTYFTPPDNTAQAVADAIDQSRQEVLVQAYGFTHNGIAQALVRAVGRGVNVKVILDKKSQSTNQYVTDVLAGAQIPVRLDGKHAIAHNKVIVIDTSVVITGSFNFTNSAQTRNAENLLILRSADLANSYKTNWLAHWSHSN